MTDVSTSLVHPSTAYRLTTDGQEWVFGHPVWWLSKGAKAQVGMDANNQWGTGLQHAKEAFWEHVADHVVWPSGSQIAADIMRGAKIAEKRRVAVDEGHLELF